MNRFILATGLATALMVAIGGVSVGASTAPGPQVERSSSTKISSTAGTVAVKPAEPTRLQGDPATRVEQRDAAATERVTSTDGRDGFDRVVEEPVRPRLR